jgi:hypothetical protein
MPLQFVKIQGSGEFASQKITRKAAPLPIRDGLLGKDAVKLPLRPPPRLPFVYYP